MLPPTASVIPAHPIMHDSTVLQRVESFRHFTRFYTRQIGLLDEGLLKSPFSLPEARVIYELAHHEETTATHLAEELGLDAGYLSRVLRGLHERDIVDRETSSEDRRQVLLSLTRAGQDAFAKLNRASREQIASMLQAIPEPEQDRLVHAMATVEQILGAAPEHRVPYILRPHQSGDLGWIVQRHGVLYNTEHGWNEDFEALVAEIVAHFIRTFQPGQERMWIAEKDGENVGSVALVRHPDRKGVAKLRILLVEPRARGLGIGRRLVHECTRFARQAGYHTITLWTMNVMSAARSIYEREGYRLVSEEPFQGFGQDDLVSEQWEMVL